MGMFDSINQPVSQGNGGSFAQKQQMQANPIMQNRPAMNRPPTPSGNGVMQSVGNMGMRPNPMTGARPAMRPRMGMGMPRPKPVMGNTPLAPAQGLAPSQLPANPSPGIPNLVPPGDVPPPQVGVSDRMYRPPALAQHREQGQAAGQDMSWMNQPGAVQTDVMPRGIGPSEDFVSGQHTMDPNPILNAPIQPQYPAGTVMDENGLEPRRGPR
jgi:hypothetical protein